MHKKVKLNYGELVLFHRMWLDGVPIKVLANKMGLSHSFVSYLALRYGLPSRHTKGVKPRERVYRLYINPPRGSIYGFPKEYPGIKGGNLTKWLLAQGYPQELIVEGLDADPLYVRWFLQAKPFFRYKAQIEEILRKHRKGFKSRAWAYGKLIALWPEHAKVKALLDNELKAQDWE